ncbi:Ankyrin-2 [Orbilia brochopaga]|nr:Ankyrin-2 [Drechslerella brochopaga]
MGGGPLATPEDQFLDALLAGDPNAGSEVSAPGPGTCEWILTSPEFTTWREGPSNQPLWIYGNAGCGKSTMSSFLLREKQKWALLLDEPDWRPEGARKCIVAGCFSSTPQTPTWILRTLLYEILRNNRDLIDKESPDFWQASSNPGQPTLSPEAFESLDILAKLLGSIADHPDVDNLYLIIDGRYPNPRDAVSLSQVIKIVSSSCSDGATPRWIISTRPNGLDRFTESTTAINLYEKNRDDIVKVARSRVKYLQKLHTAITEPFAEEVVGILTQRADGMFLWLSLALDSLEETTMWDIKIVKENLQSIPYDVQDIYGNIFDGADKRMQTLLRWIFLAGRRLKATEVVIMWTLVDGVRSVKDIEAKALSPDSLRDSIKTGNMKAFLALDEDDSIYPAHPSVKDFVDQMLDHPEQVQARRKISGPAPSRAEVHAQMAEICLVYLNLDEIQSLPAPKPPTDKDGVIDAEKREDEIRRYIGRYEFLEYSIKYLGLHLRESGKSNIKVIVPGMENFFEKSTSALRNWVRGYDLLVRCTQGKYTGDSSGLSLLFIAARLNLISLAEHSLSPSGLQSGLMSGISIPGIKSLADSMSSVGMVRQKIINFSDMKGWSPLHVAADSEAVDILVWLLSEGAAVDSITIGFIRPGRTALHFASSKASDSGAQMVLELLKKGANPGALTTFGGNTPLHYAVQCGSVETVKLLVRKTYKTAADPNVSNYSGMTALHKAVSMPGLEAIVEVLLDYGGDPEKTSSLDRVGFAREMKSLKLGSVIKNVASSSPTSTLKAATDAARGTASNQTALHIAVRSAGTGETVKLLLEWYKKAHLKRMSKDSNGYTALHTAAAGIGCAKHTALLLESNLFDVNAQDNNGRTPLILYARRLGQQRSLVELGDLSALKQTLDSLLTAGAAAEIRDKEGKSAGDYLKAANLAWAEKRLIAGVAGPLSPTLSDVSSPPTSPKKGLMGGIPGFGKDKEKSSKDKEKKGKGGFFGKSK